MWQRCRFVRKIFNLSYVRQVRCKLPLDAPSTTCKYYLTSTCSLAAVVCNCPSGLHNKFQVPPPILSQMLSTQRLSVCVCSLLFPQMYCLCQRCWSSQITYFANNNLYICSSVCVWHVRSILSSGHCGNETQMPLTKIDCEVSAWNNAKFELRNNTKYAP